MNTINDIKHKNNTMDIEKSKSRNRADTMNIITK